MTVVDLLPGLTVALSVADRRATEVAAPVVAVGAAVTWMCWVTSVAGAQVPFPVWLATNVHVATVRARALPATIEQVAGVVDATDTVSPEVAVTSRVWSLPPTTRVGVKVMVWVRSVVKLRVEPYCAPPLPLSAMTVT